MSKSVSVQNVSREFVTANTTITALQNASFEVTPGDFVALIGPSGCGKSTILRCIAGLDTEYTGTVLLDGKPVHKPTADSGVVFQEHRLLPWLSVKENILFGVKRGTVEAEDRAAELLALMRLEEFADAYPYQLSGGMAQRTAIARALAPNPSVLLLDEPFGALDAFTRIEMQQALEAVWQRYATTTILVTHDIDEAIALARRVVVMAPRPGRMKHTETIDLAYPRGRGDAKFSQYRAELLSQLNLVH